MDASWWNGSDNRDVLGRNHADDPEPEIETPRGGWCHPCLNDEAEPTLTPATTTRAVPHGRFYRDVPMCAECGSQHDNRAEREWDARVNG